MQDTINALIPLTQNKFAIVDEANVEMLGRHKWQAALKKNTAYAIREKNGKKIRMHRVILNAPPSLQVDHINGNGLDNRRENLRSCTNSQNQQNGKTIRGKSKFKGVSWCKTHKRWRADIGLNGGRLYLGRFDTEELAAKTYDRRALELFGEFACTNKELERSSL